MVLTQEGTVGHPTPLRKLEHIMTVLKEDVEAGSTLLDQVILIHQALPEADLSEVDTRARFLGKTLSIPLMITGMTGGHPFAGDINRQLARAAENHGIAIGVGSQRAALVDPSLSWTYKVVREEARSVPVVANIGAPQLVKGDPVRQAEQAVSMIEADALAIHLNPGQEAFQPEGDVDYRGVYRAIGKIIESIDVPIIVKETGSGISMETASRLRELGVKYIDVSGLGGTNWIKVEMFRALEKGRQVLAEAGRTYSNWGIPTAVSIVETRWAHPDAFIIASGGIRNGLDIARAIIIGADLAGMALPMIRALLTSERRLDELITRIKYEVRAALYLTGSRNLVEFKGRRPVLGERIISWIRQRGIQLEDYLGRLAQRRLLEP